ncbi:hypothetical protein JDS99_10075 [Bacillus cereus group sp. N6]|uniref:sigma factor n=1 Tax=Bacillus cereus group sp. N6 TaxID=2794583 RepID=UPI0018F32695|nr:sigma factor [Bacillus cereus group sp. N6]MBJ8109992.1 hypothetical protein [Bacillus cereus group sp. N6]
MFDTEEFYLKEVEKYKHLMHHEKLLIVLSKSGYSKAKFKLGQAKQELVISITLEYLGSGLSFIDLINEANLGLMRGIEEINNLSDNDLDEHLKPFIHLSLQEALSHLKKQ